MKHIRQIAWQRFSINSSIVAKYNGQFIATLFYFTILVPFGLLSAVFMDPLRRKSTASAWLRRPDVPTDLNSAREQG